MAIGKFIKPAVRDTSLTRLPLVSDGSIAKGRWR